MTEEDARLALLQVELNGIQSSIRSLDTIDFQIKGWCVTTGLAVGGFAVAYKKPALCRPANTHVADERNS
jgi:hypothetical protein